jgi:hypothetical protein
MLTMKSDSMKLAAWVMALCPIALAVVFHAGIRPQPLSIENPQLPALAFHQYAVDLRKIHQTTETQAYFDFENRGTETVHINKMEPSCGCLLPRLQGGRDGDIPPGERGRIVLRMQPANSTPGPHQYTITVNYTDPEPREAVLTLKLVIPETYMSITPPALMVYHPEGSQPTMAEFTITNGNGKPFDVTDISVNSDLVEAVIGERHLTPDGKFQQTVTASISGELPPGKLQVLMRISTTNTDVPELRVPMLLQGPVRAGDAEPSDLEHADSQRDNGTKLH